MSVYSKILVAIDLSDESSTIARKAFQIASDNSEVFLLFVQEPMDSVYLGAVPYGPVFVGMEEIETKLKKELEARMSKLGEDFGIPASHQHILSGNPASGIRRFAEENSIDLVVLGTHGQKGVQLLLGSTANSVLHGVGCDVLAVRIYD
ncbi:MAG TPA: universal stress protein [Xanthomonadales bacterium]|nr:universal stress protein [Xanthomonadales bacterium]